MAWQEREVGLVAGEGKVGERLKGKGGRFYQERARWDTALQARGEMCSTFFCTPETNFKKSERERDSRRRWHGGRLHGGRERKALAGEG